MKHLLTIALVAVLVSGCRKEGTFSAPEVVSSIRQIVSDSMGTGAAAKYQFNNIDRVTVSPDSVYYLVRSKEWQNDFLALWIDRLGRVKKGVRVHLQQTAATPEPWAPFNGSIAIHSLSGNLELQSEVKSGLIEALHPKEKVLYEIAKRGNVAPVQPDPYQTLSEVVVVGTRSNGSNFSYSLWMSMNAMFGQSNGGYYGPVSGGGASTSTNTGAVTDIAPIHIDDETAVTLPAIDVDKYLRCFDLLPDAGASYSVEILTDIPVDNDPNKLVDWQVGSAGHTFLQLRKQVGSNIVMQNIGFYPVNSWKVSFTNAPVPGKFVDNGQHEYNASLRMQVSAENFDRTLNELRYLARSSTYDLDEFNCTDLALRVFNAGRSHKLDIPLYAIPGGITAAGTSTPQGLYTQLKAIQVSEGPEAANISLPKYKGFVANSNGACN